MGFSKYTSSRNDPGILIVLMCSNDVLCKVCSDYGNAGSYAQSVGDVVGVQPYVEYADGRMRTCLPEIAQPIEKLLKPGHPHARAHPVEYVGVAQRIPQTHHEVLL